MGSEAQPRYAPCASCGWMISVRHSSRYQHKCQSQSINSNRVAALRDARARKRLPRLPPPAPPGGEPGNSRRFVHPEAHWGKKKAAVKPLSPSTLALAMSELAVARAATLRAAADADLALVQLREAQQHTREVLASLSN